MLFSRNWLQEYIKEDLPQADILAEQIGLHSFEVEGVEEKKGDYILDIDILPNRAHDALSYLGMSAEIAVVFDLTFKMPEMNFKANGEDTSKYISLKIEDSGLVRRATKRLVQNVKVGESPDWLVKRLEAMGQQSINNVVDITNYVMFEFGQPIHAFDFDKLNKKDDMVNISIRGAEKAEKIKMLDGKEFDLGEGMLVIADDKKALDIAGIKGGIVSGVDENTKNIMLSVCSFEPSNIRKTSKKLGLHTDASARFEKDISPDIVIEAMNRVSKLIAEIADGDISPEVLDEYPKKANPYKVGVSIDRVNKLLGTKISAMELENIFSRFGFEYEKVDPVKKVVTDASNYIGKPYKYGASIVYDAPNSFDCSSFIAYLFARVGVYVPHIEKESFTVDQYVYGEPVKEKDVKPGDLIFINTKEGNIWTETQEYMKGTLVPEGVDHVVMYLGDGEIIHATKSPGGVVRQKLDDYKYKNNIVGYRRMFSGGQRYVVTAPFFRLDLRIEEDFIEEIGRIYGYENILEEEPHLGHGAVKINKEFYYVNKIRDILVNEGFSEVYNYTFVQDGEMELENALAEDKRFLRKSLSEGLALSIDTGNKNAPLLGVDKVKVFEIGTVFSGGKEYVELATSEDIGNLLEDRLGVKVGAMPMNVTELLEKLPDPENYNDLEKLDFGDKKFSAISQYPFVLRDIAVWVPHELESYQVHKVIKSEAGELCVNSYLFDTYKKEDRVSYAFKLVFQSYDKTLTDEEVNVVMEKINKEIAKNVWEVR